MNTGFYAEYDVVPCKRDGRMPTLETECEKCSCQKRHTLRCPTCQRYASAYTLKDVAKAWREVNGYPEEATESEHLLNLTGAALYGLAGNIHDISEEDFDMRMKEIENMFRTAKDPNRSEEEEDKEEEE